MPKLLKVCGLTKAEDVLLCNELGVDFMGFIFASKSPRYVPPEFATSIPRGCARRVGVFVGTDAKTICATASKAKLDLIQLHSGEDEAFCQTLGAERVIKVLWPERCSAEQLSLEMERFAPVCAYFLLDAGQSGGGSGKHLDWQKLATLKPPRPWLLAGGIGVSNLSDALVACSPNGLDMNSALESSVGVKDHTLLRQAVELIKNID